MFALCRAMEWAHLPVAGGLYDQDPLLIEQFLVLFEAVNDENKREMDKQKRENESKRKR